MAEEHRRQQEEELRLEQEAQEEMRKRREMEEEWGRENQEVSIIVTSWDDERKCWFPVEVFGPVGRELRMFVERRRVMLQAKEKDKGQVKGNGSRK